MLYVTQLIYVHPGKEAAFEEFEARVLPLLGKYRGELLLRLRTDDRSVIGGTLERPYEVHFLRFEDESDLERYGADEERQRALPLKDEAVRSVLLVTGRA